MQGVKKDGAVSTTVSSNKPTKPNPKKPTKKPAALTSTTTTNNNKHHTNDSSKATSDAAELVLKNLEKQRASRQTTNKQTPPKKVEFEKVSELTALQNHNLLDESELDRRQRLLHEQLALKEAAAKKQATALEKLRKDLKALEEPIKAEIFQIRTKLEEMNRQESGIVSSVNNLRHQLHEQEIELGKVREKKQELADSLIKVMAEYEKRKTERLNEIASIVGDGETNSSGGNGVGNGASAGKKSGFSGF